MEETKQHPALRYIEVGRGYGVTLVPVVSFGNVGRSTMLHILRWAEGEEGQRVVTCCGSKGDITEVYEECDPKAVRVAGANVCYRCRVNLGKVPMPHLKTDADPITN